MNENILIVGNFAESIQNPGGQHIRSTMIRKLLKDVYPTGHFISVDLKESKLKNICLILKYFRKSDKIVAILASRSTYLLSWIFYFIGCVKKVEYVAVGGWLPTYLRKHPHNAKVIKKMKLVFLQTKPMFDDLSGMGFKNIVVLPNFRESNGFKREDKIGKVKKFVFCARITKDKGAALAIEAIRNIRISHNKDLSLDFYGPIQADFNVEFQSLLRKNTFAKYCGYINNSDVINTLSQYDCMLLPTYYSGEGFPGSILEAFMAGLPVITTDWNYNSTYVFDNVNGFLCQPNDLQSIELAIDKMVNLENKDFNLISANAFSEGQKYSFDYAKTIYQNAVGITAEN